MCPEGKRKAAGAIDCFSLASAFSKVASEGATGKTRQDFSEKNKQKK